MRFTVSATVMLALVCWGSVHAFTVEQEAELAPPAATFFGRSISLGGDTLAIGALNAVHFFERVGDDWTDQGRVTHGASGFGARVARDGDTVLVGAPFGAGRAFVYVRDAGPHWTMQAELVPSDPLDVVELFGAGVALDGDTAIVGAPWSDVLGLRSGAAFVFVRSGEVWTEQARLVSSDGSSFDQFGQGIAVSGDTAVVGAPIAGWGAAYVFSRSGGAWTEQATLTPHDAGIVDEFGYRVALDGDRAIVNSFPADPPQQGAAYIFERVAEGWTEKAKLVPGDGASGDKFGVDVGLDGDTAIVGAFGDDFETGSAYVFRRTGSTWTELAKLLATDGAGGDEFGFGVAVDGATAVVGARFHSSSGSAYVFSLNDCRIELNDDASGTSVRYDPDADAFDVVSGMSSDFDRDYSDAECLVSLASGPFVDPSPDPAAGEMRYYLAKGQPTCAAEGYGDSSLAPDPRDALEAVDPCP